MKLVTTHPGGGDLFKCNPEDIFYNDVDNVQDLTEGLESLSDRWGVNNQPWAEDMAEACFNCGVKAIHVYKPDTVLVKFQDGVDPFTVMHFTLRVSPDEVKRIWREDEWEVDEPWIALWWD